MKQLAFIQLNKKMVLEFNQICRYGPFNHYAKYSIVLKSFSPSGLSVAHGKQVKFQDPIVQNITYSSGSQTVNITYSTVSTIEMRNPNGFGVKTFLS